MTVCIVDISAEALERAKAEVNAPDGQLHGFTCDVSDLESVQELKRAVFESFGEVGFLFNNAGKLRT
jgi:NAD(P)-dependent dehydrogenase (short-subunit alcohol dehydrogenase family)